MPLTEIIDYTRTNALARRADELGAEAQREGMRLDAAGDPAGATLLDCARVLTACMWVLENHERAAKGLPLLPKLYDGEPEQWCGADGVR